MGIESPNSLNKEEMPKKEEGLKEVSEKILTLSPEDFGAAADRANLTEAERRAIEDWRDFTPEMNEYRQELASKSGVREIMAEIRHFGLGDKFGENDIRDYHSGLLKMRAVV